MLSVRMFIRQLNIKFILKVEAESIGVSTQSF